MSEAWIDIVGIGEDGLTGLGPDALAAVKSAEIIIGGDRHHSLSDAGSAKRVKWPSPFNAMISEIRSYRGKRLVILVTGDPLWYSVGARILKEIPADEIRFHPQLSAFQLAACRVGWSLADCETLTIHGRATSQIVPHVAPRVRLLVLTKDSSSPKAVADTLIKLGYSRSRMSVLAAMGGPGEQRFDGQADNWDVQVPDFHTLAVECIPDENFTLHSRVGGLPDDAFVHDGQMTKSLIRSITLSALAPFPDALLWDVGAGCGSVGVEWMRAARGARAIAIEPKDERLAMIGENAKALGTEKIEIIKGKAPDVLQGLSTPDAVFIGGGLTSEGVFETCWGALRPGGRVVANAVTVQSEARLVELHADYGGTLNRISVSSAEPVGKFHGWKPAMPITQWVAVK